MAKPTNKFIDLDTVTHELSFLKTGGYTLDFSDDQVTIARAGITYNDTTFSTITSFDFGPMSALNLTGIAFVEADVASNSRFEPDADVNELINDLLTAYGVKGALDMLTVNGSKADAFKLIWDFLDDPYVASGDYYNTALNASFVRLGIEYANYLDAGGTPLTDVVAKYAADNDADGIPQRYQSMHDNLLGNIATVSIEGRNLPDALEAELLALVPTGYGERAVYSGTQSEFGGVNHDGVRSFDYDRGWIREDYIERNYDGVVHASASRDTNPADGIDEQMYYGNGNTIDDWNIVRHEGAEVELALKVKHRGGDEYDEGVTDADGITHYTVVTGASPSNVNRAEWNFDFSATDYSSDDDYVFTVELDIDPTDSENWVTIYSSAAPLDSYTGVGGSLLQNSFNIAFVDLDPLTPGNQNYGFGEAEWGVRLTAREVGDTNGNGVFGETVLVNEIRIHVEEPAQPLQFEVPPIDLFI